MTTVATVCSKLPTAPYYHYQDGFLGSCKRVGIEPVILGLDGNWGGLCSKPKHYRHWLRENLAALDTVILSDCWDVVLQSHPDEVEARWKELWPDLPVIFNAENGLFPRGDLAEFFPETKTFWRYLNSGFIIGKAEDVLTMIESVDWDSFYDDTQVAEETTVTYGGQTRTYQPGEWIHCNDQGDYQYIFSQQPVPIKLDTGAELCAALHGITVEELDFSGPKVKIRLTDTTPGFLHANGGAKEEVLPQILGHLSL